MLNGHLESEFTSDRLAHPLGRGYASWNSVMPSSDSGQSRSRVSLTISRKFSQFRGFSMISSSKDLVLGGAAIIPSAMNFIFRGVSPNQPVYRSKCNYQSRG